MAHTHEPVNVNAPVVAEPSPWAPIRRAILLLFGILIALIGIRILFLVLGANAGNVIVDAVYGITEPFVIPFRGIFSINQVSPDGTSIFDFAALVAMIGWALIAVVIEAILRIPDRTAA